MTPSFDYVPCAYVVFLTVPAFAFFGHSQVRLAVLPSAAASVLVEFGSPRFGWQCCRVLLPPFLVETALLFGQPTSRLRRCRFFPSFVLDLRSGTYKSPTVPPSRPYIRKMVVHSPNQFQVQRGAAAAAAATAASQGVPPSVLALSLIHI